MELIVIFESVSTINPKKPASGESPSQKSAIGRAFLKEDLKKQFIDS